MLQPYIAQLDPATLRASGELLPIAEHFHQIQELAQTRRHFDVVQLVGQFIFAFIERQSDQDERLQDLAQLQIRCSTPLVRFSRLCEQQ